MLRKDHHRALAAWSRQLGPVYAIRILFWHVRTSPLLSFVTISWSISHGLQYPRQGLNAWPRQLGPACAIHILFWHVRTSPFLYTNGSSESVHLLRMVSACCAPTVALQSLDAAAHS